MIIAALATFVILLVAWILAPSEAAPPAIGLPAASPEPEALPEAA
jgi:hypothetical protein